jgi:hypothetical protein
MANLAKRVEAAGAWHLHEKDITPLCGATSLNARWRAIDDAMPPKRVGGTCIRAKKVNLAE